MDAVAAEAGVGKGTLFRRFGDRASLARAVISEYESQLQDELIRGAAPLGPGAPPLRAPDRLRPRLPRRSWSATATCCWPPSGTPGVRLGSAPYAFYRTHVTLLLREAGCGERADYLADVAARPAGGVDLHATTARCASCRLEELGRRLRGPLQRAS